jgi:hypothetical protein
MDSGCRRIQIQVVQIVQDVKKNTVDLLHLIYRQGIGPQAGVHISPNSHHGSNAS